MFFGRFVENLRTLLVEKETVSYFAKDRASHQVCEITFFQRTTGGLDFFYPIRSDHILAGKKNLAFFGWK